MATKTAQTTKQAKSSKKAVGSQTVPYRPNRITFGVAAIAALTLVVFALLLTTQMY